MTLTRRHYKIFAEVLLAIPIGLITLLAIGELSGGVLSGLQHVFQLIPFIGLALLCWYRPLLGGRILLTLSALLFIWYLFTFNAPLSITLVNDFLVFGFPMLAGGLFILSARHKKA